MPSDIILIGPVRTGKSTVGRLLAGKLGVPQVSLDDERWAYYKEIGYDRGKTPEETCDEILSRVRLLKIEGC